MNGLGRKLAVLAGGIFLLVAGTAMLILPGPGILTIGAGLVLLAREFPWARRLVDAVRQRLPRSGDGDWRWWNRTPQHNRPVL